MEIYLFLLAVLLTYPLISQSNIHCHELRLIPQLPLQTTKEAFVTIQHHYSAWMKPHIIVK